VISRTSAFYYHFSSPFTGYLLLSRHFIFIIILFISIITFLTKVCHHHHLSTNINILKLCKANITCNVTCFPRTSRHKTFHFTVLFQTATLLVFRVRDVIFRISFSRTFSKKKSFLSQNLRCCLKKYSKMKCLMTSCTRKTSNVASYICFTVLICLYRFHCFESIHHNIIVMAYEVTILIILLYYQN